MTWSVLENHYISVMFIVIVFIFRIKSYLRHTYIYKTYISQQQISQMPQCTTFICIDLKNCRYTQWGTTCMYFIHCAPVVSRTGPAWVLPRCAYSHGLSCYCANSHPIGWAHMRTFSSHHIRGNARTRIASHARKCAHMRAFESQTGKCAHMRAFASNARKCGHSHRVNKLSHKQSSYEWFDTLQHPCGIPMIIHP